MHLPGPTEREPVVGWVAPTPGPQPPLKRFHDAVPSRPPASRRDATQIADEVIATSPTPDHVVRTVTENNRRLNVTDQGYERE